MKFEIYAGLGGSMGGAQFEGIYDFKDEDEAEKFAYEKAVEEYESYAGMHGLIDYEGAYEDCEESGWIDDSMSEDEIHEMVEQHYRDYRDSWLEYSVRKINE